MLPCESVAQMCLPRRRISLVVSFPTPLKCFPVRASQGWSYWQQRRGRDGHLMGWQTFHRGVWVLSKKQFVRCFNPIKMNFKYLKENSCCRCRAATPHTRSWWSAPHAEGALPTEQKGLLRYENVSVRTDGFLEDFSFHFF